MPHKLDFGLMRVNPKNVEIIFRKMFLRTVNNLVQNICCEQKLVREKVASHAPKLPLLPKQPKQMKKQQEQGVKKKAKTKKSRIGEKRKNPFLDRSGKKGPQNG